MKQTFPDEVIVNVEDIYSFVEMDYRTKFYTKTGKTIIIYVGYDNQFESYVTE